MTSPALDQKALAAALACPFCGSRAIHIDRGEEPDRSLPLQHRPAVKPWSVICIDCNCRALGGTEDSAMRAWNRRAALPAPEPVATEQEPLSDNESTMSAMERADRLRKRGYVLLAASERLEREVHDRAIERLEHIGVDGI